MEIITWILIVAVVLGILFIVFTIFDQILAVEGGVYQGVVLERDFTPESTHTGVGPAIGGRGGGVAVTVSSESEKWVLIVKLDNGTVEPIETSKENWVKYQKGDKVAVEYTKGRFTGEVYLGDIK